MRIITLTAILTMLSFSAYAHQGVIHYKGQEVKTSSEAMKVLKEKTGEVSQLTAKKKLTGGDLEMIHKISYSLETASDKLAEEHKNNQSVEALEEAVQGLHFSAEKRKEKETREWFGKLEEAVRKLKV